MEYQMGMEKIITPMVVFFRAVLLMVYLMAMADSLCQMEIIIKGKLSLEGLMGSAHTKLTLHHIKEILKIM
jgi:hypothetical protein